jgi:hypothetical protein
MSLALDPVLVPWFARHGGNGGVGVCVAAVLSEVLVLVCGVALAPRGVFVPRFWRTLWRACVAGAAMTVAARALSSLSSFLAAPIALAVFAGTLWAVGGIDKTQVAAGWKALSRKLGRRRAAPEAQS